jgi:hypothetical protein
MRYARHASLSRKGLVRQRLRWTHRPARLLPASAQRRWLILRQEVIGFRVCVPSEMHARLSFKARRSDHCAPRRSFSLVNNTDHRSTRRSQEVGVGVCAWGIRVAASDVASRMDIRPDLCRRCATVDDNTAHLPPRSTRICVWLDNFAVTRSAGQMAVDCVRQQAAALSSGRRARARHLLAPDADHHVFIVAQLPI